MAAKLGADVTLTDHPHYTNVLENCSASVKLNDLRSDCGILPLLTLSLSFSCPVEPLEWGELAAPLLSRIVPDIVIGADIFYNSKGSCLSTLVSSCAVDFEDLFATIRFLMERNPRLIVWTTYQNRRCGTPREIAMLTLLVDIML